MPRDRLDVMGMELPILCTLEDGYFLVAHNNGPAIATETTLSALSYLPDLDDMTIGKRAKAERLHCQAIAKFIDLVWPLVQTELCK